MERVRGVVSRPWSTSIRARFFAAKRHDPLEPHWATVVVIGFRITSLVMQGHANIVVGAAHAGAVRKLLHLRLRAGPTSEISIATNGCEVS